MISTNARSCMDCSRVEQDAFADRSGNMGQQYDCRRLWELLSELVAEGRSGTLYIKSDDAHAGMISLREGEITSILYRSRFGAPAVELIRQVRGGTCRFDSSATSVTAGKCPPTQEILRALAPPGQNTVNGSAEATRRVGDKAALQGFLEDLSGHLQSHIGPIAAMVVEGVVQEMGRFERIDQAESLISRLMGEIDDEGDASSFFSAAQDALKKAQGNPD